MGFKLTASGDSDGYLEGPFSFREWGSVDLTTFQGVNTALQTIDKKNNPNSQVTIWFGGQTDLEFVWGTLHAIEAKGAWKHLQGHGTYKGDAASEFSVTFTGKFRLNHAQQASSAKRSSDAQVGLLAQARPFATPQSPSVERCVDR